MRAELKPIAWVAGFVVGSLLAAGAFYSVKFLLGGLIRGSA